MAIVTENWPDVQHRYTGLKGWFWHLPYLSPTHEFLATYVAFAILAIDDAKDILDAAW